MCYVVVVLCLVLFWGLLRLCVGLNKNNYSRQTKDTVNYCVLINKLLKLMGYEFIQLEKQTPCVEEQTPVYTP